jgi:hypothetical protein
MKLLISRLIIGLMIMVLPSGGLIKSAIAESASISMVTDETRYVRSEIIKLLIKNNLDIPVWYIDYPQQELIFWTIERFKENNWYSIGFNLPIIDEGKEVCRLAMYERPIGFVTELRPKSNLFYEWNQKICMPKIVSDSNEPEMIERGRYRFALHYSLDTVKSENVKIEPWKRPIELGEIKVAYSNEFILE